MRKQWELLDIQAVHSLSRGQRPFAAECTAYCPQCAWQWVIPNAVHSDLWYYLYALNTTHISDLNPRVCFQSCSQKYSIGFWPPNSTTWFFWQRLFDCQNMANETVLDDKLWWFEGDLADRSPYKRVTPCLNSWSQLLISDPDLMSQIPTSNRKCSSSCWRRLTLLKSPTWTFESVFNRVHKNTP